jgi:hypothetical protein
MAWDSDVAYAFRRSPVAMISGAVTLILILRRSSRRSSRRMIRSTPPR